MSESDVVSDSLSSSHSSPPTKDTNVVQVPQLMKSTDDMTRVGGHFSRQNTEEMGDSLNTRRVRDMPTPLDDTTIAMGAGNVEDLPLTNGSLALAEFTSLLRPSDPHQLKEHLIHLIQQVDKEDVLVQLTRRLEDDIGNSTLKNTVSVSAMTSSCRTGQGYSTSRRASDRWAQSTMTNQTHTDTSVASDSTNNIMQLHGGVNLMGNTTTKAVLGDGSQSGTSLNMENEIDPLEEEEPIVPMMRREGRREAVSAAPLSMASLQSFQSSLRAEKSPAEARQLLRLIRNSHLFSRMEDTELDGIVRAMAKEEYQGGEDILVQGGEPKEKLFVLAEGACEVIKNGRSVATVHVGATFGELEMMYKQATNAATVRCVANCVTYTLDEVNYHRAVMNDSLQKRKRYVEVVQNVPFLKCLPEYERLKIAEALLCKSYKRGQTIIKFGQKGDLMHCIMKGTVKVVGRNNGKKVEVVRLGENDVVGELEFLFGHLTVADVIATSRRVVTACITRKHFELIAGPIQDRLKEFVATSPTYENYYINEVADMSVRSELSKMGSSRRSKRIASKGSDGVDKVAFGDIEAGGELVMTVPQGLSEFVAEMSSIGDTAEDSGTVAPSKTQKKEANDSLSPVFRYPLMAVAKCMQTIIIGLREDGLITAWNHSLETLLSYSSSEVVGQNIYSFLLDEKDQKMMYHSIVNARSYAGNVDDFLSDIGLKPRKYTLARSDGLTKAIVELSIIPPLLSAGDDNPEVLMAFGKEVKGGPQSVMDQPQLLSGQISAILADSSCTYEARLLMISEVLHNFEETYRALTVSTERLRVVNIRQLLGQVIMDFGGDCVQKGLAVRQRFEGLSSEMAYLDAELLPECLRYAMSVCLEVSSSTTVTITVTLTEKNGLEFLIINFNVDGIGFPEEFEAVCEKPINDAESDVSSSKSNAAAGGRAHQFRRVRAAVEKQGGTVKVQGKEGDSNMLFLIPFMKANETDAEDMSVEDSVANVEGMSVTTGRTTSCSVTSHFHDLRSAEAAANKESSSLKLPGAEEDDEGPKELGMTTMGDAPAYNFTTLVAEDTAAHRNMLCTYLWDRKHAVLPAHSLSDIKRLAGVADILFIDLQQSIITSLEASTDPITYLREMSRQMAIVITAQSFDLVSAETYQKAGFITLRKPCTPVQAMQAIRLAEEKIAQVKQEAEKIAQTRALLSKNSRGAWKRGKLLGKGSFGEVFEAIDVLTGGTMAVKEMHLGRGSEKVEKVEQFVAEISTMCNLQHPNIIHYFYCEENTEENVIRVFMEYAAGGTLQKLFSQKGGKKMEFKQFQKLLHEITQGLAYIHSQRYVHCDIKTANVLLGHDGMAKIGDFGTARTLKPGQLLYDMQGSPLYMSPECMAAGEMDENGERIGFSFPTDIWSLGCVALEMITNAPPFSHVKQVKGPAGLTNYVTSLTDVPDLSILFDEPPSVIEFVAACLNPDPEKRATAQDLLQFGIFSEANDEQTMSAVKALKRAQLLHVLNQFVAFQEPEDRERSKTTVGRRAGTDFFDSSSSSSGGDDDSDDEMVKVSLTPKKANDTKVTSGSSTPKGPKRALSTDDDEPDIVIPEDASPTPKKRSKTVAPEGSTENPNRSATNNSTDNNNSNARNTGKDPLHKRSASEDLESGFFHSSDSSAGKSDEENPHQKGIPTLPRPATVTSSALTRNPTSGFGNHSFGAPNASFYNFSFNKNISFLGGNIDDVLNSAANEFLHGLSGGVDVKSPDEMRILHSVETSRDNSRRASKSPSIRSPDTSAVGSRREEDSNSGLRAISRQQLARPGVVNRSFFMVEDLQIPFLSNSSVSNNNVVSMVTGGTTQNSSTQEIPAPRDAAGRRQAIRFADPNAAIPITLTEETLQIHQGMMDREGDSISPRTVDQASSQFHSISSDSKGLDSLAKVQEELQEIAKGLSAFLYSRSAPPPLVAKNAVSISSCSSSAGKEPGDNPLSNGSSAGDGVKCLPPGKPPAVPPSDSHLQRLFGVLSHVQSLSTYVRDQLKSKQEEEFSALDKKK